MTQPGERAGGYLPIGDYALLGDGRATALVARDGRVDWLAVPTMDTAPVCAALLDPQHGGTFACGPVGRFDVSRRYLPDTNVLETTFTTADGVLRVTDAMTVGRSGPLPWRELARKVECVAGTVELSWRFAPGTMLGAARPWVHRHDGATIVHVGDVAMGLCTFDAGPVTVGPYDVAGGTRMNAGDSALLALVAPGDGPVPLPTRDQVEGRLAITVAFWEQWSRGVRHDGPWRDHVVRSALALRLLQFAETGGILAAPTTSLPETPGGDRNWDYRYAWIRDGSFTLDALLRLDLTEEAQSAMRFLLIVADKARPGLPVFATLRGDTPDDEVHHPDVPGYRGARPVRRGNQAAHQRQLGNYGDLLESVWLFVRAGHVLDLDTGTTLADIAHHVCDVWQRPDSGIWEFDETRPYTISKMGCWVALDRAIRLAEAQQVPIRHVQRWRDERAAVHEWVSVNCWSQERAAYTAYAGTDDLDAAVLLAARTGFTDDASPRLRSTIDAVRNELGDNGLLYRTSGLRGKEGAFVACSFWLADALTRCGDYDEAAATIDGVVRRANDVGLLAEEIDPTSGEFLGNFPQGLSHLALITSASTFAELAAQHSD